MASAKPLNGLTVIEIGHSVAAPFAGLIFAELGAEVLKVENPNGGDHARGWGPPFWKGTAAAFHAYNRGKKGLTVDLGDPQAVAGLRRMILARSDVVIQNLRAGVFEAAGLGADALLAEKPELIVCNLGAFGAAGPLAGKPGYDPLMQAFAGLMSITGEGGGRPPVRTGASLVDMGAGMWATIGILATLVERARTKRGGCISTSLYETALAWLTMPMASYGASGETRRPYGSGVAEIVPYQCFPTRDGWLMIAAGNDGLYGKLCTALHHPEWAADGRFRDNAGRVAHRDMLLPMIEDATRNEAMAGLAARLDALGIPNAPLQDVAQVAAHPQTEALGILRAQEDGGLRMVGLPVSFDGERPEMQWPVPHLGEHNTMLDEGD